MFLVVVLTALYTTHFYAAVVSVNSITAKAGKISGEYLPGQPKEGREDTVPLDVEGFVPLKHHYLNFHINENAVKSATSDGTNTVSPPVSWRMEEDPLEIFLDLTSTEDKLWVATITSDDNKMVNE